MATSPDDMASQLKGMSQSLANVESIFDGWMIGGQNYIDVPFLESGSAQFTYPPWNLGVFRRASTQPISTGAWTAIAFDTIDGNAKGINYSTASTGLFSFAVPSDLKVFLLSGVVHWESSAGQIHGIKVVSYPSTEEVLLSQVSGYNVAQSFGYFYRVPVGTTAFNLQAYTRVKPDIPSASFNIWEMTRG